MKHIKFTTSWLLMRKRSRWEEEGGQERRAAYLVNWRSLASMLRCRMHILVKAEPISLVAPGNKPQLESALRIFRCYHAIREHFHSSFSPKGLLLFHNPNKWGQCLPQRPAEWKLFNALKSKIEAIRGLVLFYTQPVFTQEVICLLEILHFTSFFVQIQKSPLRVCFCEGQTSGDTVHVQP